MNVQPSQHNPPFQDIAQGGLSLALVRDGRAPMTGPLNMNGNKITGVAQGTQPNDVVTLENISDLAVDIGDGAWSINDKSPNWLRRNGGIYDIADYPVLAAKLPPLPDGVTYAVRSIPSGTNVNKITHADGKSVAVCDGGRIYVTEDFGVNWDQKTSGTSENLVDIAYGNGVWCAIAQNKTTCISSDADTWTNGTLGSGIGVALCIAYGDGLFVVGGHDGLNYDSIVNSADAVTWSSSKTPGTAGPVYAITYSGSMFLAISSGSSSFNVGFRSTDGESWTSAVTGASVTWKDIASDGSLFVMVGDAGNIWTTTNGTTFTQRSSGTTNNLLGVDWAADGGWILVGAGGVARISTNGTSWTASATGTASSLNAITHDPGRPYHYLIGGASGLVLDGTRTSPTQFQVPNDDPTHGWIRAL